MAMGIILAPVCEEIWAAQREAPTEIKTEKLQASTCLESESKWGCIVVIYTTRIPGSLSGIWKSLTCLS
jgi:hypothetical protein